MKNISKRLKELGVRQTTGFKRAQSSLDKPPILSKKVPELSLKNWISDHASIAEDVEYVTQRLRDKIRFLQTSKRYVLEYRDRFIELAKSKLDNLVNLTRDFKRVSFYKKYHGKCSAVYDPEGDRIYIYATPQVELEISLYNIRSEVTLFVLFVLQTATIKIVNSTMCKTGDAFDALTISDEKVDKLLTSLKKDDPFIEWKFDFEKISQREARKICNQGNDVCMKLLPPSNLYQYDRSLAPIYERLLHEMTNEIGTWRYKSQTSWIYNPVSNIVIVFTFRDREVQVMEYLNNHAKDIWKKLGINAIYLKFYNYADIKLVINFQNDPENPLPEHLIVDEFQDGKEFLIEL